MHVQQQSLIFGVVYVGFGATFRIKMRYIYFLETENILVLYYFCITFTVYHIIPIILSSFVKIFLSENSF